MISWRFLRLSWVNFTSCVKSQMFAARKTCLQLSSSFFHFARIRSHFFPFVIVAILTTFSWHFFRLFSHEYFLILERNKRKNSFLLFLCVLEFPSCSLFSSLPTTASVSTLLIVMFSIFFLCFSVFSFLNFCHSFHFTVFHLSPHYYDIQPKPVAIANEWLRSSIYETHSNFFPFTAYFWCHCHSSYFHFHFTHPLPLLRHVQLSSSM